jgi:fucose permease
MTQSAIVVAALAVLFGLSRAGQERKAAAATSAATTPGAGPGATSGATTPGAGPAGAAGPLGSTLRSPVIWLLIVSIACAVGIELGSIGLLTTYLMELRGFTQVTSKVGLLLFIGGFGIGRVVLAGFIRDDTVDRWVLGYFAASILTTALLYVLRVEALLYAMTMLSGLSVSVLLPSIIASAGQRFPDQAGTAIGIIKLGIPVGGMLLPFLSSLFTRLYSFQTALLVFPAAAAVGVACMFVVVKMPRQAARNSG